MASVTIGAEKTRFGAVEALHGVDIGITDGSFSVLVGPAGCGKSTRPLMLARRDQATMAIKVGGAAEILGPTQLLDRSARQLCQLSGGQRQRVATGRAIVHNPPVFRHDEPLSKLDARPRVAMRTGLKELHQRLETTSVCVGKGVPHDHFDGRPVIGSCHAVVSRSDVHRSHDR